MKVGAGTDPGLPQGRYGGLDAFKLLAAMLVVAVHTGPLVSYDAQADFMLTGIAGRLAVPFFFAASGFLFFRKLTGDEREDGRRLRRYAVRIAGLYGFAMLLYLPLNIYKGDFREGMSALSLARDVAIDGTFYHLWYLPALLIGIVIVYYLRKWLGAGGLAVSGLLLYAAGLLGDSYYGLAVKADWLGRLYGGMFEWFDYTRNGFFFAPVYIIMGLWAARHPVQSNMLSLLGVLLSVSLAGLFAEGILLREAGWPRHDSMYVLLLPAVYFLLRISLLVQVRGFPNAGELSQWIYIVHPAAIVAVRGAAEVAGMEILLVGDSLIHYIAVCLLSAFISAVAIRVHLSLRSARLAASRGR